MKPENMTEEEWQEIARSAGFGKVKSRDYHTKLKTAFDQHWAKKKELSKKPVVESRDITEPLDPYADKGKAKEVTS